MLGLELEPELIARIDALGLKGRQAPDIAAAVGMGQGLPAVFVVYQGYRVLGSIGDERVEGPIEALWYMVIGVRDVSDTLTGAAARAAAAPMVDTLVAGLRGWTPPSSNWPVRLAQAPRPQFSAGTLWLPVGFTTTSIN